MVDERRSLTLPAVLPPKDATESSRHRVLSRVLNGIQNRSRSSANVRHVQKSDLCQSVLHSSLLTAD